MYSELRVSVLITLITHVKRHFTPNRLATAADSTESPRAARTRTRAAGSRALPAPPSASNRRRAVRLRLRSDRLPERRRHVPHDLHARVGEPVGRYRGDESLDSRQTLTRLRQEKAEARRHKPGYDPIARQRPQLGRRQHARPTRSPLAGTAPRHRNAGGRGSPPWAQPP